MTPPSFQRAARTLLLALAATSLSAWAQQAPASTPGTPGSLATPGVAQADRPIGAATREWLALQRGGRLGGTAHPVPGEIATLTWRRHVESFRQPIPESFNSAVREAGSGR